MGRPCRMAIVCAALCALSLAAQAARAGSVTPMNVPALSDLSGQVIVGRVESIRSYWADQPRRIESEVRFESVEYFKGRLANSTGSFSLTVPGGKVGQMQMQIADAPAFAVGEKWVLFLLPTYKTFPVAGLHQGAFKIAPDAAGVERIYQADGQAVVGLGGDGMVRAAKANSQPAESRLVQADRVQIQDSRNSETVNQTAVSLDEFRQQIAPILQNSRNHHLTEPAGKRIPVQYTPVPFRSTDGRAIDAPSDRGAAGLRAESAPEATHVAPRKATPALPEARP